MPLRMKGSYGLALLFSAGIAGWMATGETVYSGQADDNPTPPPAERNQAVEVKAVRVAVNKSVARARNSILDIRGRTEAETKIAVRSETTALVRKRLVEKGQWVSKGTLLCELDAGSRQAKLAQAEAQLAQADFDLNAKTKLSKKGFAAESQVTALRAKRDAALASVKEAKVELERVRITAPFSGVVQAPLADIGDQLTAGGTCVTLMNPDPMLVVGQVSERNVSKIKPGSTAKVKLVTGEEVEGKVRYVATASDIETRTFRVEVEVPNSDKILRDGVTATASVALPAAKAHLMSPAYLTLSDGGVIGVKIVEDSKAKFVPITILANDAQGVWITGLEDTVTVITVGQEYVKTGQAIEAVQQQDGKLNLPAKTASNEGNAQS